MRPISIICFCLIAVKISVVAELSPSACSVLRTAASITTIVPELAQMAMRYYQVVSPSEVQHRQKRFILSGDTSKSGITTKASVFENMIASSFKDVNYTRVAHLILNNNETMAKIRQNVDVNAIVQAAMRQIDYEKLGSSLYYSAEAEFDLEYVVASIINITHIDLIYEGLITNGTLSASVIKSLHPDINVQTVQQLIGSIRNFIRQFGTIMNSTQSLEEYLFKIIQQYGLTPLGKMITEVKNGNPTTLDQLVEIVLDNLNKAVMVKIKFCSNRQKNRALILGSTFTNKYNEETFDE